MGRISPKAHNTRMNTDFTVVPVSPSAHEEIVSLHMRAFEGYANTALGPKYVSAFIHWFERQPDTICLMAIANKGDQVLGYVLGAPEGYQRRLNRSLFPVAFIESLLHPRVVISDGVWSKLLARVRVLLGIKNAKHGRHAVFRLVSMGVSPSARQKGVATSLVKDFEAKAAAAGYAQMELSVFSNNGPARSLYEKCGYSIVDMSNGGSNPICTYQKHTNPESTVDSSNSVQEAARIRAVYSKRERITPSGVYSHFSRSHLLMLQETETEIVGLLKKAGLESRAHELRVLDVGCGNGYHLRQFIQWGFSPENLHGIDVLPDRIRVAQRLSPASVTFTCANADMIPYESATFDLVCLFTVFSSIIDLKIKEKIAAQVLRVLRPGGCVVWHDFFYDNPRNVDVKGVSKDEIRRLFPNCDLSLTRVTPLPPLMRRIWYLPAFIYALFSSAKILSTHYIGLFRKK